MPRAHKPVAGEEWGQGVGTRHAPSVKRAQRRLKSDDAGEALLGVGGEGALGVLGLDDEISSTQSAGKRGYRPIPVRQAGTDAAGSWPGRGAG